MNLQPLIRTQCELHACWLLLQQVAQREYDPQTADVIQLDGLPPIVAGIRARLDRLQAELERLLLSHSAYLLGGEMGAKMQAALDSTEGGPTHDHGH